MLASDVTFNLEKKIWAILVKDLTLNSKLKVNAHNLYAQSAYLNIQPIHLILQKPPVEHTGILHDYGRIPRPGTGQGQWYKPADWQVS